jgi:hypothetical protein
MAAKSEDSINSYVDREGVKGDTDFIIDQLKQVYESFKKVNQYKIDLGGVGTFRQAGEAVNKLKLEMDELQRVEQGLIKTYEKRQVATSEQAKSLVEEKTLLAQKNAETKREIELQNAANGSIEKARAVVKSLTAERNKLDLTTAQGIARNKELNLEIDKQNNFIKANVDALAQQKINVGNYSGAVKVLEDALVGVRKKMDDLTKSGNNNVTALEALNKEEGLLVQLVNNQANGFASATSELRNNEKALQQLAAAGLQNTEIYNQLLTETSKLKDNVLDLKQSIKNLASDSRGLDGLVQGAQALAGAYGIAQGAAALFGDDNEDLQKTFVKLQAVQTILVGLQGIQNALQKESSVMLLLNTVRTGALAGATKLYAFVTGGATVAARVFNTVLLASGIGVIIALLITAASAMESFGSKTKDATQDILDQAKAVEELNRKTLEYADITEAKRNADKGGLDTLKRELQLLEASGGSDQKRFELRKQILEKELENIAIRRASIDANGKDEVILDKQIADKKNEISANRLAYEKGISDKLSEENKKRSEDGIAYAEKERAAAFEIAKLSMQEQIETQKLAADNANLGVFARVEARNKQFDLEKALAVGEREFLLQNEKLTATERELVKEQSNKRIEQLEVAHLANLIGIRVAAKEKEKADIAELEQFAQSELDKGTNKEISRLQNALEARLTQAQSMANAELGIELDRYTAGEIDKEEYEKRKNKITAKFQRESLEAQIAHYEGLVKIADLPADAEAAALKSLADLKQKLRDDDVAGQEKSNGEKEKNNDSFFKKYKDKLAELSTELQGLVFDIFEGGIEKEKQALDSQLIGLDTKKKKDIEVATQTIANAQLRAEAIARIEALSAQEKEKIDRRQRELDIQKAKFERLRSIASIIQNTGMGISAALASIPPNPILAAIVGAIGAAQVAKVLATPLPKYKHGRKATDTYEGLAVVGDGGKSEAIVRKDGSVEFTPKTDTLTHVRKGDVIIPDAEMFLKMAQYNTGKLISANVKDDVVDEKLHRIMLRGFEKLNNTIKQKEFNAYSDRAAANKDYIMNRA